MSKPITPWIYDPLVDPLDYPGFIYKITFDTNQYYVGKKFTYVMKANKIVRESDWRTYQSSSQIVKDLMKTNQVVKWQIVEFAHSRGKAGYLEERWLWQHDALLDPLCLNGNLGMKFNHRVVKGYHDDTRCEKYLAEVKKQRITAGLLPRLP